MDTEWSLEIGIESGDSEALRSRVVGHEVNRIPLPVSDYWDVLHELQYVLADIPTGRDVQGLQVWQVHLN
jgi:hypothetical protein